jgi:hypothetical protein
VRVLFDENVPLPLRKYFPDGDVATIQEQGWSGITNGQLVQLADGSFDVLVLADKIYGISRISLSDSSHSFNYLPIAGRSLKPSPLR